MANLANLFDPELVILGGTLRDVFLGSAAQVRSRINTNALAAVRENLRLRVSELGGHTVLIGAAELAFSEVLTRPLETLTRISEQRRARPAAPGPSPPSP
ncbi:ROK family protein [Kitasatospora sp. NPDC059827]|uniref:ROK family protein n=1 Tax=Kitasatospora sp. NPDC059827 TaxID=3346964 RepID=UPI0036681D6A